MRVRSKSGGMGKATGFLFILALCLSVQASAAPSGEKKSSGKHHVLKATKETVQWGWLDPSEPPKLTVSSGDTISIETWMHALDGIHPGVSMEEIIRLRKANPGGGPHSLTGPIFVTDAEPGDVMEIRILKIVPKASGTNFHLPGAEFPTVGLLASEFKEGFVRYYKLYWKTKQTEFKPGVLLDLKPFPGVLAAVAVPTQPKYKARP